MVIAKDRLDEFKGILEKRKKLALETAPHIVHGYMVYKCDDCNRIYNMYLEKGLEDPVSDEAGGKHKPVPFAIVCPKCFGSAYHIAWRVGSSDEYEELESGKNFFMNDENEDCGIPVIFNVDMDSVWESAAITEAHNKISDNRFGRRHSKKFEESRYVRPRKNERKFY